MTRKIAVFSGNRAEYGLLYPVLRAIEDDPALDLALIVGGAHLSDGFGRTEAEIARDGFAIAATAPVEMADGDRAATARAIGQGILSTTAALEAVGPDVFLVYADRYEGFAALVAATQMGIPTVHMEGGDLTEGGALDDTVRHAMTKLAHVHMTTNAEAARRVRALGEEAWRIHDVGFPTIDLIRAGDFAPPEAAARDLGLDLDRPVIVFTQHSITTEPERAADQVRPSLDALARAIAELGAQCVLTYPNNDAGGAAIARALEDWSRDRPGVVLRRSLGRRLYHGVLNLAGRVTSGACVGNSSSGIKETPAFACPTVNIGSRQAGRLAAGNTIDVPYDADAIFGAIATCVTDSAFRARVAALDNPYGAGDTGATVVAVLKGLDLADPALLRKRTELDL